MEEEQGITLENNSSFLDYYGDSFLANGRRQTPSSMLMHDEDMQMLGENETLPKRQTDEDEMRFTIPTE